MSGCKVVGVYECDVGSVFVCVCVHALASLCVSVSSVHTSEATNFSAARLEMCKRPLRT